MTSAQTSAPVVGYFGVAISTESCIWIHSLIGDKPTQSTCLMSCTVFTVVVTNMTHTVLKCN